MLIADLILDKLIIYCDAPDCKRRLKISRSADPHQLKTKMRQYRWKRGNKSFSYYCGKHSAA